MGVSYKNIGDPLPKLLLTNDKLPSDEYHRKLLTYKGKSTCRLEVSFYGTNLYKPSVYKEIIQKLIPGYYNNVKNSKNCRIDLNCFSEVEVGHYFTKLFEGEKEHGRFIFLEELKNKKLKLQFVRFINQVTKKDKRLIGFEIIDTKEKIFKIML